LKVRFWGTRGTRPTPGPRTLRYGGNTTCVEVRDSRDRLLIIDSGSGIAELGATLSGNGPLELFLLITHTHWDHIQGFPFFGPNFVPGTRITVVGPAGSIKSLQGAFADQMDPAYFPLRLDQVPADLEFVEVPSGETFTVGDMRVTPHEMNHPIVTLGYRIEESGSSFVFATDNELCLTTPDACASLSEWCQGADLLAHDAQYSAEEYPGHEGWGHSTYDEALSLAEGAGVHRLAFVHHDPLHSDADIDALVEDAMGRHQASGSRRTMVFAAAEEQLVSL
jgi:phosphoribosyl 1,2-cyclic phosphodiesterase